MIVAELRASLLRACLGATARYPGDEPPRLRAAIIALPRTDLLAGLAPEYADFIRAELAKCTDYEPPSTQTPPSKPQGRKP